MIDRFFYTVTAAILLFIAFLLFWGAPDKAEAEWRTETWIKEYCLTYEAIDRFVSMIVEGDETALLYMRQQIIDRKCFKAPKGMLVAFEPSEIAKKYANLPGAVLIRGNLVLKDDSRGQEAFVVARASELYKFQNEKKPSKVEPEQSCISGCVENGVRYQEV